MDGQTDIGHIHLIGGLVTHNCLKTGNLQFLHLGHTLFTKTGNSQFPCLGHTLFTKR